MVCNSMYTSWCSTCRPDSDLTFGNNISFSTGIQLGNTWKYTLILDLEGLQHCPHCWVRLLSRHCTASFQHWSASLIALVMVFLTLCVVLKSWFKNSKCCKRAKQGNSVAIASTIFSPLKILSVRCGSQYVPTGKTWWQGIIKQEFGLKVLYTSSEILGHGQERKARVNPQTY